jgi:hypothetical protein
MLIGKMEKVQNEPIPKNQHSKSSGNNYHLAKNQKEDALT